MQQVVIGIDSAEMLTEIEVSAPSDFDFGLEDVSSEESDTDDDYEMVKNMPDSKFTVFLRTGGRIVHNV